MAIRLLEMFIEFSQRGFEAVKDAFATGRADAQRMAEAVKAAGTSAESAFEAAAKSMSAIRHPSQDYLDNLAKMRPGLAGVTDGIGKFNDKIGEMLRSAGQGEKSFDFLKRALAQAAAGQAALSKMGQAGAEALKGLDTAGLSTLQRFVSLQGIFKPIEDGLTKLKTGFDLVGKAGLIGFGILAGSIGGFVRAGIQGSAVGEIISFRMAEISRQIASLFLPQIRAVVDWLGRVVDWFHQLTGAQQSAIGHWLITATVTAGVAMVLPRIVNAVSLVVTGLKAMSKAMAALGVAGGMFFPILGIVVAALTALAAGSEVGREGLGKFMAPLKDFAVALGGLLAKLAEAFTPVIEIIGAVVIPVIKFLTAVVDSLDTTMIRVFATVAVGVLVFLSVVKTINFVIESIQLLIKFLKTLTIAQIIQQAFSGPGGWAAIAAGAAVAAAAVAGVVIAFDQLDAAKAKAGKDKNKPREDIAKNFGGVESITASYDRIAAAGLRASFGVTKRVDEQQLDELTKIREGQERNTDAIRQIKPGFKGS